MKWSEIKSLQLEISEAKFWKCLEIWIIKPFFYSKYCRGIDCFVLSSESNSLDFINSITSKLRSNSFSTYSELTNFLKANQEAELSQLTKDFFNEWKLSGNKSVVLLRILYLKSGDFNVDTIELIACDFQNCTATFAKPFHAVTENLFAYQIAFDGVSTKFLIPENIIQSEYIKKLVKIFFDKLPLWIKSELKVHQINSMHLVPAESYIKLYNDLKEKYIKPITQTWTESTDPDKVIHQAIAIATYLLVLWGNKPQQFVDLGCGSGLLVHILNSENHKGIGIDVRSRKIWSTYPSTTILKEITIVPSDEHLFPNADWIIGNHSDELSPWIPVIAARSAYKTNFFLLPCCSFEFDGSKYVRKNATKSQYMDFLDYIENICTICGFNFERDRLRIPSTKRICFVSRGRSYEAFDHQKINDNIKDLLEKSGNKNKNEIDNSIWVDNFKPREAKEKVRNCTTLNKDLITTIISKIADIILQSSKVDGWNEGAFVRLRTIADQIPGEILNQLKNECGGLQTVLRNNRFIFLVEKGQVKFRKPMEQSSKPSSWKVKPCWFFNYHPQSCPLEDEKCSFIHSKISQLTS